MPFYRAMKMKKYFHAILLKHPILNLSIRSHTQTVSPTCIVSPYIPCKNQIFRIFFSSILLQISQHPYINSTINCQYFKHFFRENQIPGIFFSNILL